MGDWGGASPAPPLNTPLAITEKVQKKATKIIPEIRRASYQRYISDKSEEIMIEMYKILTGKYDVDGTPNVRFDNQRQCVQIRQRSSKVGL